MDSRNSRDPHTGSMVNWIDEPGFDFADEVDALQTLTELGEELAATRSQAQHVMRYLRAAVLAAREQVDASPTAIIGHSGLSRRTVYQVFEQGS